MKRYLSIFAILTICLSFSYPAHADSPDNHPSVGDQLAMDGGGPAPLSDADMKLAGSMPVIDDDGTVVASSLDDYRDSSPAAMPAKAMGVAQPMAIGPCKPFTGADNPHRSKSENVASAHGWWKNGNCSGSKAKVRTCLLEWWKGSDGSKRWITKKCVTKTIKAAPKKTRKPATTARVGCTSDHYTGWANLVDVDVVGVWDDTAFGYKTDNFDCRRVP